MKSKYKLSRAFTLMFSLCFCVIEIQGYSSGAPLEVCNSIKPEHGVPPLDNSKYPPPYEITPASTTVFPGQVLPVHLDAKEGTAAAFIGFMISARKRAWQSDRGQHGAFVGELSPPKTLLPVTQTLNCNGRENSSVTHISAEPKRRIILMWQAPIVPGEYVFRATFVQSYDKFWVNVTSAVVTVQEESIARPTDQTTAVPKDTSGTGEAKQMLDDMYRSCIRSNHCFGMPENCESNESCKILFAWDSNQGNVNQPRAIHMKIIGDVKSGPKQGDFIAVGISKDDILGNDTIFGCYEVAGSDVQVRESVNGAHRILDHWKFVEGGIKRITKTSVSSPKTGTKRLFCEFDVHEIVDSTGRYREDVLPAPAFVNLTADEVHLFLFQGHKDGNLCLDPRTSAIQPCNAAQPGEEKESTDLWRLSKKSFILGEALPAHQDHLSLPYSNCPLPAKPKVPSFELTRFKTECGTKSGCIGLPDGCLSNGNCKVFGKFSTLEGVKRTSCERLTDFELFGKADKAASTQYISLGLSHDRKMGNDVVFGCYLDGDSVSGGQFYNVFNVTKKGFSNARVSTVEDQVILHYSGSKVDGYMTCRFIVKPFIDMTKQFGETFDLTSEHLFVMLARGDYGSAGGLGWHSDKAPSTSPTRMNSKRFLSTVSMLPSVHGAVMVIAWVLLVTVGQFTARYYKDTFDDVKIFGKAWWFTVHQYCMISAVALTVIGVIVIFADVGDYMKGRDDSLEDYYHPILGLLLTCLAIIQVCGGFLRPHPDNQYRFVFNWAHWVVGTACHWIAIASIFLANGLSRIKLNATNSYWCTLVVFVLLHFMVHGIISIYTFAKDNPQLNFRGLAVGPQTATRDGKRGTRTRLSFLLLEAIIALACTIALIVYIARST